MVILVLSFWSQDLPPGTKVVYSPKMGTSTGIKIGRTVDFKVILGRHASVELLSILVTEEEQPTTQMTI